METSVKVVRFNLFCFNLFRSRDWISLKISFIEKLLENLNNDVINFYMCHIERYVTQKFENLDRMPKILNNHQ